MGTPLLADGGVTLGVPFALKAVSVSSAIKINN